MDLKTLTFVSSVPINTPARVTYKTCNILIHRCKIMMVILINQYCNFLASISTCTVLCFVNTLTVISLKKQTLVWIIFGAVTVFTSNNTGI